MRLGEFPEMNPCKVGILIVSMDSGIMPAIIELCNGRETDRQTDRQREGDDDDVLFLLHFALHSICVCCKQSIYIKD